MFRMKMVTASVSYKLYYLVIGSSFAEILNILNLSLYHFLTHDCVWRGRCLVPGAEESNVPLVKVSQHPQAGQVLMMKIRGVMCLED